MKLSRRMLLGSGGAIAVAATMPKELAEGSPFKNPDIIPIKEFYSQHSAGKASFLVDTEGRYYVWGDNWGSMLAPRIYDHIPKRNVLVWSGKLH